MDSFNEKYLLALAAIIYFVGLGFNSYRFYLRKPPLHKLTFSLVLIGLAFHSVGLHLRGLEAQSCPIRDPFEVLQFISWSIVVLYVITGSVFRLSFFGTISSTLAAVLSGISFINPAWDIPTRSNIFGDNHWIETHAALSLFSYGIFGILAATSILYLLQNYSLKRKSYPSFFNNLPSIYEMDQVIYRLHLSGCIVFSVAMGIGYAHWINRFGELSHFKLLFAHLLWFSYLITFCLSHTNRLRSSRRAWTLFSLFVIAILILWPVGIGVHHEPQVTPPALEIEE